MFVHVLLEIYMFVCMHLCISEKNKTIITKDFY